MLGLNFNFNFLTFEFTAYALSNGRTYCARFKTRIYQKKNKNLSRDQIRTLNVLRGRARVDSEASHASIEKKLGVGSVSILIDYISKCQLNINFEPTLFKTFAEDTHYRSVYEIKSKGAGYDSLRDVAENRIFLDLYAATTNFERPKYGSIDIHNQPGKDASIYGKCYFVLDDNVKIRTTIAKCDTFGYTPMGVLDYPMHVLDALCHDELKAIYDLACGLDIKYKNWSYKEVQYHGPISFIKDIKCVCMPKEIETDKHFIDFITKFDLNYCTF